MQYEWVALVSVILFMLLIAMELHVAIAIAIAGLVGIVIIDGSESAIGILETAPFTSAAKFSLFVIPMYVLLGALISQAGIGERIYRAVAGIVGKLPGGLGAATVLATAVFSGISGSSAADVAAFGRIAVNEMSRYGYTRAQAAAIVAAAGAFAALIPPSVTLVLYAIIAEQSVGALVLAGVVPGIASALLLAAYIVAVAAIRRRKTPEYAASGTHVSSPASAGVRLAESLPLALAAGAPVVVGPQDPLIGARPATSRWKELWDGGSALLIALILFTVIAGGIYSGFVTATEAGALGAFVALIISAVIVRKGPALGRVMWNAVQETARTTSMIFLILLGGSIFTYSLVLSRAPRGLAEWISELPVPPLAVVGLMLLMLLPLGTFLDGLSIMLITVPIMAPVAESLGFSGIWFGILVLKFIEIGLITPPVGINIFVISGIAKEPAERIFRAVFPFVLLDIAFTTLLFFVPEIVLWLPRAAGLL